jgi:hypothetical protein
MPNQQIAPHSAWWSPLSAGMLAQVSIGLGAIQSLSRRAGDAG